MRGKLAGVGLALASLFLGYLNATAFGATKPYSYCSKDNCYLIRGTQNLFFGPLPESVVRTCVDPKMYALTFDDGPTENWDEIFNLLDSLRVKATFFINGQNLTSKAQKERILKAHQQGHQISNHSTHHMDFLELDEKKILEELEGTRKAIVEVLKGADLFGTNEKIEFNAKVVRPPFGHIDQRVAQVFVANSFVSVRWNSDRYDWELEGNQSSLYLERLQKHLNFLDLHASDGIDTSIVDLNHDRSQSTLDSLVNLVSALKGRGYRFVTVSECMGRF